MRYAHEGMTVWTGTQDAPAPGDAVSAGAATPITIGVQPVNASNQVEVRYRVNEEPPETVRANWIRNDTSGKAQYFQAKLPPFQEGDTVEYTVICRCAGRQIPPAAEAHEFAISFDVTAPTLKQAGDSQQKKRASRKPTTAKAQAITRKESTPSRVDDSTDRTSATRGPSERVAGFGSKSGSPGRAAVERPLEAETSGEAEDESQNNPSIELAEPQVPFLLSTRDKKRLNCLKRGLSNKPKEKLDRLFEEASGDFSHLSTLLEESQDFDDSAIRQVNFANDLAELTDDNEELVGTFLSNNKTNSLRDIALNVKNDELKVLIKNKTPTGEEEETESKLKDRLFRMAPAAVIHGMTRDNELETDEPVRNGLLTFFDAHPELDFRKESILKTLEKPEALENIPEAQRDKVVHSLKCCQRLSSICPTAEAVPPLMKAGLDSAYAINEVPYERFVALHTDSLGGEEVAKQVHNQAQNISVRNEHALISLRDAVLSPSVNMVHAGLSPDARKAVAIQIAQQKDIPINFETLFGGVDLCECKHCNSVYSPAAYLVELFQFLRNNNLDPDPENEIPVSEHTGKSGIAGTPLKKFFRRRRDLGRLQLTCENTNTLIPYIDLVNEVMESFVVNLQDYEEDNHDPKQAKIAVHNVKDESSGELLAEPQHTHYKAYRILKNAVYPVCKLPYHQPIDATRQYLNFLGTSRYELFDTFRKDITFKPKENASDEEIARLARMEELKNQAVDRTIAAEYLKLVEEEYVILTKEGFHTKEWVGLKEQENLSLAEYHDKIGLKYTWAYYGIESKNQMLNELKWVKPAQETGMVGFLRRVNMRYVDLIELLKTRYINPNYPSGKALAFLNSLPYSYRYLQTLVDEGEVEIQAKYQRLINFLQANLKSYAGNDFDKKYVACWVYTYFEKVGKLIVLEDASTCNCIEGTFFISASHVDGANDLRIERVLSLDSDCQIHIKGSEPKKFVGHLEGSTGKLLFDVKKLFETLPSPWSDDQEFLEQLLASANIDFISENGEAGRVKDLILYIGRNPFVCAIEKETCNISNTQLQHLDGSDLTTKEYDRMHRFIRLWCKLDWRIAEVDQAIAGVGETINNPPTGLVNFTANANFVTFFPTFPTEDDNDSESTEELPKPLHVFILPETTYSRQFSPKWIPLHLKKL